MASVIDNLTAMTPGGRNDALNHAAWTLGRWIAVGALKQADVEGELYAAAEANGLVATTARANAGRPSQRSQRRPAGADRFTIKRA